MLSLNIYFILVFRGNCGKLFCDKINTKWKKKAIRRKNKVKIYITGSVASGKSTLARRISQIIEIPCYHLDEVVHIPAPEEASGNKKRLIEERNALFHDILNSPDYVMEDAGRVCFAEGMRQADIVILLEIPPFYQEEKNNNPLAEAENRA